MRDAGGRLIGGPDASEATATGSPMTSNPAGEDTALGAADEWNPDAGSSGDRSLSDREAEGGGIVSAGLVPVGVAPGGVPGGLVPGAYLPPSTVHRPPPAPEPAPQMPLADSPQVGAPSPAPAGDWNPPSPVVTAPVPAPIEAGRASLFADLPFDAPDSLTEWLVAIGSVVAAVSFLLPWIPGTISYVTSWGLGTASRLPILVLLVVTAVLAILPNRVAPWVRSGVLALVAGALFLGNIWPIVVGDYGGAAFGVIVAAAAAVVLIAGGILGLAPRRGRDST